MSATPCPSCGNVNPLGTERCAKCGTVLPAASRTVTCPNCGNVSPMGVAQCAKCGAVLPVDYLKPMVVKQKEELTGIKTLRLTGIMLIIGGLLLYIFPIAVWAWYGYQLPNITCCPLSDNNIIIPPVPHNVIIGLQAVALAACAFGGIAWILFGRAFGAFSAVDPSFRMASISAWIGFISIPLVAAAIAYDISAVAAYLNCSGMTPVPADCYTNFNNAAYTIYWLWAFSIMFLIFGGIGVLIGLFRVGARYLTATFWIAGFLMIFPILLFLGAVLLVFGASGAQKRLESWVAEKKSAPATAATGG